MTLYPATTLNNITIDGRKVGVAFRAHFSSPLAAIRYYVMSKGAGYAGGNGGRLRHELCADAAGKPGTVLSTGLNIEDHEYTMFLNNGGFPLIAFPGCPVLVKSAWYHFIITNIDETPKANFSSYNGM